MDALGDRMKMYEQMEAGRRFLPYLPVVARLDGKNFSNFTKGMRRPYDEAMTESMQWLTKAMVEETNACCGYTQSDEITLAWYSADPKSQIYFDARITKMTSVLAATASVQFNRIIAFKLSPQYQTKYPVFDCRVWQMPTLEEAVNVFQWREFDATKNSISMAAQHFFSHKELHKKHTGEMQEMLFQKGVNWNDYPPYFKRGSYYQRRAITTKFTAEELATLPPLHDAHKNPDLTFERHQVRRIEMPPLASVQNRVQVIFQGEEPITFI